jgi:4-hydroxy-tetrahydrodipicolinate synthase
MELKRFCGTGTALVTPFRDDGSIDEDRFVAHVHFQIEGGVEFLVPCGTTGEGATLTAEEQREVIALAVEASAARVPVMAGAGGNKTDTVVRQAQAAQDAGASAILSVSPYYNKPTPAGLVEHYRAIAEGVDLPVFVYNVPGRTASNITPEVLLRIAEIEGVKGVKEASGNVQQVMAIIRDLPQGFLVLSGDDVLALPHLASGADGLISVAANQAPDLMSGLVRAGLGGDFSCARDLHYRLLPLMTANFIETNPIPVKTGLEVMGRGPAFFRLPLTFMEPRNREVLRAALEEVGLIP